jgi:hypothetical protein
MMATRDENHRALTVQGTVALFLNELMQLPAVYSRCLTEVPDAPGESLEARVGTLRELFKQMREAGIKPVTAQEPSEMRQTESREIARAVRSGIIEKTREWLAAGEQHGIQPEVRKLVTEMIGPDDGLI